MTKQTILALFCLITLAFGILAAPRNATGPQSGSLTDPNIRYVGRWDKRDPHLYHSYWTGAYLRTGFTGTSVRIKLASGTALAVSIDGEPLRTVHADSGVTALNAAPLQPGGHTLLVGSPGQNEEVAFQGLSLAPGVSRARSQQNRSSSLSATRSRQA